MKKINIKYRNYIPIEQDLFIESALLIFALILMVVPILLVVMLSIDAQAQETTMTASVPENEVSHCVQVLKDAGYIK